MEKVISDSVLLASQILLLSCFYLQSGTALDTITPSKSIKDPEFIISQSGVFRLGFFSFANSSNRYVGILYHQISVQTVVWVANRNKPLKDTSGILNISDDGKLVVLNGKAEILWSSNVTNLVPSATTAQLLDSGNLVLNNGEDGGSSLWESFQDPSNAFIETMEIGTDVKKGRKVELKSWKRIDDPSDGNFSFAIEPFNIPEGIIRKNNKLYFRTGPWNGNIFLGVILTGYLDGFYMAADNQQQTYYLTYKFSNNSMSMYYELNSQGKFVERQWDPGKGDWINRDCKDQCLKNCSCVAYAYDDGIGCMFWGGDLIDVQKFSSHGVDLYIRLPSSEFDKGKSNKVIVFTTAIAGIVIITISALFLWCRMAKQRGRNKIWKQIKLQFYSENVEENLNGAKLQQLPLFNFKELATATDNFHDTKKLGQGGFGPVYRGTLDDGKEIAVKRLSKASGQGLEEFMNEVMVISKLQHRNLVRLFGCCVEGEEKMLVYEYMPNTSLDAFLFG
ncbi:hypothetical protein GOBAR_DD31482 [Gossypium barbadense]|nr:hypothetical protein GOBAR_DD31482 [Gossypium barbadense]